MENWDTAIKSMSSEYSNVDGSDIYLKFVVATNDDFDEVTRAVQEYRNAGLECPSPMSFGGCLEEYNPNVKEAPSMYGARLALLHPRLHRPIPEMSGELDKDMKYKNKQHEKAMKAEINNDPDQELREKGLI